MNDLIHELQSTGIRVYTFDDGDTEPQPLARPSMAACIEEAVKIRLLHDLDETGEARDGDHHYYLERENNGVWALGTDAADDAPRLRMSDKASLLHIAEIMIDSRR